MKKYRQQLLNTSGIVCDEHLWEISDWRYISEKSILSEEFIREFKDDVIWYLISKNQKLSEDFIREFEDFVDWDYISMHQKLSEDFIREFQHMLSWYAISSYQMISENFIREFHNEVNWFYISSNSNFVLSEKFLLDFKNKINWTFYFKYQAASFHIFKKFITKTEFTNIDQILISHLNNIQKEEIQKLIQFKNIFKN
jgi:hypothetical protein